MYVYNTYRAAGGRPGAPAPPAASGGPPVRVISFREFRRRR